MFNFWWLVGLFDELKPHRPPLFSQNYEMLIFGFCSTSDDQPGWSMDSNPICQPSAPKKMKCSFLDYIQLLMISQVCRWTWTLFTTCLQPKNEMLIFWLCSTSDDWPGWLMDSNPIHHPSRPKKIKSSFLYYVQFLMLARLVNGLKPHPPPLSSQKMKCSYFDYVQLLVISQAGQWTQTPSTTPLHPKKWNAHFWITFNFWWSARLVDGLEPHPPPVSSQKMKCSYFDFVKLLMIGQTGQWTQTPSTTPLQPIKWNASFWIMFTFDDQPGWLMDQTRSATPLQPIKWNASFWIMFTSHDQPGWLMDSNPICHLFPAKKMKCSLLDYVHFGWSARLVNGLKPHPPPLSSQKKMKCSFLDYVQLLMISWAGQWTQTTSATPLLPKKWNAHFSNTFNIWWSARLVDGLKPHLPPLCYQKNEMLIFGLCPTSDVGQTGQWTQTPSTTPVQPKKWNASFLDYAQLLMIGLAEWWTQTPSTTHLQPKEWNPRFCITLNFWWSAGLVNGLKPHLPPLSSQNYEMLIFGFCSTSHDQPGWSMDSNPIHQPSAPKKMKCSFLDYVQLLMISQVCRWTWTPSTTCLQPKNEMLIFGLCSTSDDQPGC